MRPFSVTDANDLPPTLILEPSNDTFSRKSLELFDRIKIGRQVSAKTLPESHNGFFNSQVLSRTHAEVWYENGKVYVKDLKSSNGTYLNSQRLSPDSCESAPFELKTGDTLEFGIDVESEKNGTYQ
ncbi:SMAD/FHA domain-containing protein [Basidiobolus meristosporus CBS 931.73]|uniref:SMAD/FHA domain-containing protein n=1 Tax=Basidiobolus meristosporus CBS 931.73 TaxID=1314790 RepID=A0A1Y1XA63_9FUNG|nr:SMAD/FHA domain-containing protein [Basidiobolus meristosporus CBS 931.73]|eukprot:ORX82619.1 SMAD/FHA domain-containing protein [Basidiobolus meristosporus CBS 931.73]